MLQDASQSVDLIIYGPRGQACRLPFLLKPRDFLEADVTYETIAEVIRQALYVLAVG